MLHKILNSILAISGFATTGLGVQLWRKSFEYSGQYIPTDEMSMNQFCTTLHICHGIDSQTVFLIQLQAVIIAGIGVLMWTTAWRKVSAKV